MRTGIYVHIPFCRRRCTYCDFNTYTGLLSLEDAYVSALTTEISLRAERAPDVRAATLYFGGGTPSLLKADAITSLVEAVHNHMGLPWQAEVTLEANPGTVDAAYLAELKGTGVTRLSFGVQSVHSHELVMLGRIHTWPEAVTSYRLARAAGFDEISLDLMFGLPGQSLAEWQSSLEQVLALEPEHLSLYALTLEPGTPLAEALALHSVPEPDPDLAADMYEVASEMLHAAGFWQYEISNWAHGTTPPSEIWALPPTGETEGIGPHISQHNLIYWRNESWIGLGAGAHSWYGGRRWSDHPHPQGYINAMRGGKLRGFADAVLPPSVVQGETMMMGLRLAEGVTDARFADAFGVHLEEVFAPSLATFSEIGLITWDGERVRLTERGRLLGNQVFEAFLLDEV